MPALSPNDTDRRLASRLFLILLLLVASLHVFLIADHRLVRRHRTRLHYEMQYAFLSGCDAPGSIPLWLPGTSGGVESNAALFSQAGLLQSTLMLSGPLCQGVDFQPLYFLGVLAEELLFLVGCWLLARRHFRSPYAAFFVGVSALGSAFWLDRIELNFRAIYAVPLVLEFTHRALKERSPKHAFLAANLLWIQMLGSPPGAGVAGACAPLIYFSARALLLQEPLPDLFRTSARIRWACAGGTAIAVPILLTALLGAGLPAAPATIPSPYDLLAYAGLSNPLKYLDLLLGVTPSLDWTLYCGALTLGFALVSLRALPRATLLRLLLVVPGAMLALGLLMAAVFLLLPALRPTAPLPYATPFLRLFLVFLAGAGFQRTLEARSAAPLRFAGGLLLVGAALAALLAWNAVRRPDLTHDLLAQLVRGEQTESTATPVLEPWIYPGFLRFSLVSDLLGAASLFTGLAGGLLLLLGSRSRNVPLALTLILVVHPLDAFSWKFRMSWLETFPANSSQRALQRIEPAPYAPRRMASLLEAPRFQEFQRIGAEGANPVYSPRRADEGFSNAAWHADVDASPGAATGNKLRFTGPKPLSLLPQVVSFSPNDFRLRVEQVPPGASMAYADHGSPGWTATVNGTPRPIAQGSRGEKVLPLEAGANFVELRYRSPIRTLSFLLVALNSLAWLAWTLRAAYLLARRGRIDA